MLQLDQEFILGFLFFFELINFFLEFDFALVVELSHIEQGTKFVPFFLFFTLERWSIVVLLYLLEVFLNVLSIFLLRWN